MANKNHAACRTPTNVSKIKVEENGRSAVILNDKREQYVVSRVDGCMVHDAVACDYVISRNEVGDLFIELKGSDVDHAVEQLMETMGYWKSAGLTNGAYGGLVVCTRYPKVDTKIQRLMSKVASVFKAPLHVVTKNYEYDFGVVLSFKGPL